MYKSIYNGNERIWSGLDKRQIFHPKLSIGQTLLYAYKINGSNIALVIYRPIYVEKLSKFFIYLDQW